MNNLIKISGQKKLLLLFNNNASELSPLEKKISSGYQELNFEVNTPKMRL